MQCSVEGGEGAFGSSRSHVQSIRKIKAVLMPFNREPHVTFIFDLYIAGTENPAESRYSPATIYPISTAQHPFQFE